MQCRLVIIQRQNQYPRGPAVSSVFLQRSLHCAINRGIIIPGKDRHRYRCSCPDDEVRLLPTCGIRHVVECLRASRRGFCLSRASVPARETIGGKPGSTHSHFNGIITNDKFCMSRTTWLRLTWWRRALRSRPARFNGSVYPSDETSRRGGTHETSLENPPSID